MLIPKALPPAKIVAMPLRDMLLRRSKLTAFGRLRKSSQNTYLYRPNINTLK